MNEELRTPSICLWDQNKNDMRKSGGRLRMQQHETQFQLMWGEVDIWRKTKKWGFNPEGHLLWDSLILGIV
jgi:hypothetical protein